jgi:hypothetical protein
MVRRSQSPKRRSRVRDKHDFGYELGERMFVRGMVLHSALTWMMSAADWRQFLVDATKALGMSPVARTASWKFPLHGAGGTGLTIIQPITESFLVIDTWPDHRGAYLFICSCKPFEPKCLEPVFALYSLRLGQSIGEPAMLELVEQ